MAGAKRAMGRMQIPGKQHNLSRLLWQCDLKLNDLVMFMFTVCTAKGLAMRHAENGEG